MATNISTESTVTVRNADGTYAVCRYSDRLAAILTPAGWTTRWEHTGEFDATGAEVLAVAQ